MFENVSSLVWGRRKTSSRLDAVGTTVRPISVQGAHKILTYTVTQKTMHSVLDLEDV